MRNAMNGRAARTGSASEKFGRKVRARNARSTFDKPLACVTGIFDHAFGKPLTWIADKFTYTFDPLLTASKGISKEHLWYAIYRRSQVSKNGLYRLWSGWQRRFQRWSLMRVKSHQIRAKVAFTKPLTTHLMRGKGDFSCRDVLAREWALLSSITIFWRRVLFINCFNLSWLCEKIIRFTPSSKLIN